MTFIVGLTDTQLRNTPLPVSGTVAFSNTTLAVTGAFFQTTQPVSGTVTVGNASLAVTGSFFQATQPVSIAATVAISAASLPLPTGAALDATLTGGTLKAVARGGAKGTTAAADVTSIAVDANTQALHASVTNFPATQAVSIATMPSTPVTGTFWQATQPVSLASTTITGSVAVTGPLTDTQLRATALPVSGSFFQATQPVSIAATVAVSGPVTDTQLRASAVPVSLASTTVTGSVAVTGPLTDTQLRASAVPISIATDADTVGSGTIAALNATVGVALNGKSAMRVQITGTWVGTLQFEGTVDGTTWIAVNAVQAGSTTIPQTTTTNGTFSPTPSGFASFRVNATAWTSGTATVSIRASAGGGGVYFNQNLPAFAVIPAFKIDQTTPGTTNAVSVTNASLAVTGAFFQTTQPVSIATMPSTPVTGTFWQATQPVSGTVTAAQADTSGSGTISATDTLGGVPGGTGVLISTAPTANSFVAMAVPGGGSQVDIQITGTATGTYYFEHSMDSTTGSDGNWIATNFRQTGIVNTVLGYSVTTNGVFRGNSAGFKWVRVRNVGGTTPSNPIVIRVSNGSGTTFLNASLPAGTNSIGGVTQSGTWNIGSITTLPALVAGSAIVGKFGIDQTTPGTTNLVSIGTNGTVAINAALPTGANVIGALTANQSVNNAQIGGVAPLMGNGVTGTGSQRVTIASDNTAFNVIATQAVGANSTTGDTGAKTATGNGATLTNAGNKGVQILFALGAVSGTTPTFVGKVQGSVDGGTTFYDIPGATTASLTATGNFGITVYPGAAVTAGTTTTGTTAAASQTLPRTWRVVWTIGGTTPSFTITAVQYNYLTN